MLIRGTRCTHVRYVLFRALVGLSALRAHSCCGQILGVPFTEQGAALLGVFVLVLTILLVLWFES